ncbi:MAG: class I SAM-dependent methyltransferase [Candidatus Zixiibacteriota bacterium]
MFGNIPQEIRTQMQRLEKIDALDRTDGTPRMQRLRQIPPETGRFIALLAASAPQGALIEIGTSAGYSTLYLALACREIGNAVTTFEILDEKAALATETLRLAGVDDIVELVVGDAREHLHRYSDISFCFLDAEKEHYLDCYGLVIDRMVRGGLLVADNIISHRETLQTVIDHAESDDRVDSLVVPIGKGLLVCRKISSRSIMDDLH